MDVDIDDRTKALLAIGKEPADWPDIVKKVVDDELATLPIKSRIVTRSADFYFPNRALVHKTVTNNETRFYVYIPSKVINCPYAVCIVLEKTTDTSYKVDYFENNASQPANQKLTTSPALAAIQNLGHRSLIFLLGEIEGIKDPETKITLTAVAVGERANENDSKAQLRLFLYYRSIGFEFEDSAYGHFTTTWQRLLKHSRSIMPLYNDKEIFAVYKVECPDRLVEHLQCYRAENWFRSHDFEKIDERYFVYDVSTKSDQDSLKDCLWCSHLDRAPAVFPMLLTDELMKRLFPMLTDELIKRLAFTTTREILYCAQVDRPRDVETASALLTVNKNYTYSIAPPSDLIKSPMNGALQRGKFVPIPTGPLLVWIQIGFSK